VHAEVHARAGLADGDSLDPARIESLCSQSQLIFARSKALRLLAGAPQTRRGLAAKLRARGFAKRCAQRSLAHVELGYLDDPLSRRAVARLASRKEGWKPSAGLVLKGVPARYRREGRRGQGTDGGARRARELADRSRRVSGSQARLRRFRSRAIARLEGDQGRVGQGAE
jgi:hypothetical protein